MDGFDAVDATYDAPQPAPRRNAVRPVTIRQLSKTKFRTELGRNTTLERYSLDGEDFSTATFVGNIISVEISGDANRTIRIEDGTGKISCTQPIGEDQPELSPGVYVRVFGVPREFKKAVFFGILFIRPVEDTHEVFFHLMEAIAVTLAQSRGQPLLRPHDSEFASAGPPLISQRQPSSSSQVADGESQDSVRAMPSHSQRGDASDDGDGSSTEYYTDQPPDSPLERSPSPTPMGPFAKNHSYEDHSDRGEGPSSQSTQRPEVLSSDEDEERRTPMRRFKSRQGDDSDSKSPQRYSDEELDFLRSEISSQTTPSSRPKLKPDPYSGWSPAKRKIMVFVESKTTGEEINIKRSLGEGMSKIEMRNAIRELVKEGEIETVDGMNYRRAEKGPKYPRF